MREFNKKVEEILNKQITAEFWSARMYLSMSSWFQEKGLKGFANWMRVQYQEEETHALKIYDYVLANSGKVKLEAIDQVPCDWKSITDVFEATYNHECRVTDMILECFEVAQSEKDRKTVNMLQWFVDEQAEEESNVLEILDQLKLVGDNGSAIYLLDKDLGARVFVDATQTA